MSNFSARAFKLFVLLNNLFFRVDRQYSVKIYLKTIIDNSFNLHFGQQISEAL